jgi:hypothetical protein
MYAMVYTCWNIAFLVSINIVSQYLSNLGLAH